MKYQQGQVLLIVILVMVTALTVGLAVAARSITNVRSTQDELNSEQAFSAAEAGIEQSLTTKTTSQGSFTNNTNYQTTVTTVAGVDIPLNNGLAVLKDDATDVWLSHYPDYTNPWTGTLTLYWGKQGDTCSQSENVNTMAALEIVVVAGTKNKPTMTQYAVDPCLQRSQQNMFTYTPSGAPKTIATTTYAFQKTISITSGLLLRVIPLYAGTVIAAQGCDGGGNNCLALPQQGTMIESIGTSGSISRKLVSIRQYPKIPNELLPYTIFSPQ